MSKICKIAYLQKSLHNYGILSRWKIGRICPYQFYGEMLENNLLVVFAFNNICTGKAKLMERNKIWIYFPHDVYMISAITYFWYKIRIYTMLFVCFNGKTIYIKDITEILIIMECGCVGLSTANGAGISGHLILISTSHLFIRSNSFHMKSESLFFKCP